MKFKQKQLMIIIYDSPKEEARTQYTIRLNQTEELEELCRLMLNTKKSWK